MTDKRLRVGLNGFGRIGRCVTRILAGRDDIDLVAINHCGEIDYMCYKLKFDSTHGRFDGTVSNNYGETFFVERFFDNISLPHNS